MNKLQLVQKLGEKCGVSGTITTTVGLSGEWLRLSNWIDEAWNELQSEHDDWNWMRSSVLLGGGASFPTVSGTAVYRLGAAAAGYVGVLPDNFGKWVRDGIRCMTTSVGFQDEQIIDWVDFDYWRDVYAIGANRSVTTRPMAYSEGPNKELCLGPYPNGDYTITADYFWAPLIMEDDDDVPVGLQVKWHMAIVYKGMMKYAAYEAAPEVMVDGENGYGKMFAEMEVGYAPEMTSGSALA